MEGLDWGPVANAALLLLAAVIATLRPVVVAYIKARVAQMELDAGSRYMWLVESLADEAVRAAEQLGGDGSTRKQMAVGYVLRRAADIGIEVDGDVVDAVIEAAVYGLEPKVK